MGFEAPLALLGLLAAALPVVAHLVRRRDLPRVELPTVALLERAQAQSRRRMRLVDMLLLLARILLVVCLAAALAGPYVTVQLAYGDGRVASVAIVLDDSMSMGRGEGSTLADEAVGRALDAIESLPAGSEVAIVLAGSPPRLLVRRTEDLEAAAGVLEEVRRRTARGTSMPEAVALGTRELHGARHEARRLLVLTDGARHAGWELVAWPGGDVAVDVERLGGDAPSNRAVVSAVAVPDPTTPGQASIGVEVRAYGASDETVGLTLRRGDETLAHAEVELVGGVGRATLHGPLVSEGDPTALVELDRGDALPTDDRRAVLLRPPSSLRVLLVDGDPDASRDRDEVGFVARALELAPASEGAVTYRIVDPDTFASQDLRGFDVVVLANAPAPPAHAARRLVELVEAGGGLLVTGGDHVEPRAYAARLGDLLPARPRADAPLDPPLSLVRGDEAAIVPELETGLAHVETTRRLLLERPVGGGRVELAFEDGAPALVVGAHGDGRAAILATTIDQDWTDLPFRPGFLPLVVRLLRSLSPRAELPDAPVEPGTPVSLPPPAGATRVVVVDPTGHRREHGADSVVEVTETDVAGAYRVLVSTRSTALADDTRAAFVVAPPTGESDLAPAPLPRFDAEREGESTTGAVVRRSLSPWLFVLAGLLALTEALLRLHAPRRSSPRRRATLEA